MSRIEDQVCKKIMDRAEVGFKKYGKTMERDDFSVIDWLTYLQEELMDSVVYIERVIEDMRVEKTAVGLSELLLKESSKLVSMFSMKPVEYIIDKKKLDKALKDIKEKEE